MYLTNPDAIHEMGNLLAPVYGSSQGYSQGCFQPTDPLEAHVRMEREAHKADGLRARIQHEINCASAENGSNTPDWILAEYLIGCLAAFDSAVNARERYYGRTNDSIAVNGSDGAGG